MTAVELERTSVVYVYPRRFLALYWWSDEVSQMVTCTLFGIGNLFFIIGSALRLNNVVPQPCSRITAMASSGTNIAEMRMLYDTLEASGASLCEHFLALPRCPCTMTLQHGEWWYC